MFQSEAERLYAELEDAITAKDEPKEVRLREDLEQIAKEVQKRKGLGGQIRVPEDDNVASAHSSVTQAIKRLVDNCRTDYNMPQLAKHLDEFIDTGTNVVYRPPDPAPDWKF